MFKHIKTFDFISRVNCEAQDGSFYAPWSWHNVKKIVSLREINHIAEVAAMPLDYLERLIKNVGLEGDPDFKPYKKSPIKLARIDPWNTKVGQTFVERKKYQSLLENFSNIFQGFCITRGAAKCNAYIVLGYTAEEAPACGPLVVAHYLPPIIEVNKDMVMLDGTHRGFLIKNVGTTSEAIIIENVETPFPCIPQDWSCVNVVDAKPPREVRYKELNTKFFRDLKMVGIDG